MPALGKLRQEGGKPCWQVSANTGYRARPIPKTRPEKQTSKQTNEQTEKEIKLFYTRPDYGGKDFQHNF